MSVTNRGKRWEMLNSLWVALTVLPGLTNLFRILIISELPLLSRVLLITGEKVAHLNKNDRSSR